MASDEMPSTMAKLLNCNSTTSPTSACRTRKIQAWRRRDLAGRQRARARALDLRVDVLVDEVVVGAAGAAHGDRADQEQREMPGRGQQRQQRIAGARIGARGQRRRPPARPQQQLPADRPVPAGKLRIGPQAARQRAIDPVTARCIGDPALGRLWIGSVPWRWSGRRAPRRQDVWLVASVMYVYMYRDGLRRSS